jgi:two-component system sensor histidine kinase GlrK
VRLAAKIFAASVIPLLILIEVAGWSLNSVNRVVRTNRMIVSETLPALREAAAASESVAALVRHHARWVLLKDQAYADLWLSRAADLDAILVSLDASLVADPERHLLLKSKAAFRRYRSLVTEPGDDGSLRLRTLSNREARSARRAAEHVTRSVQRLGTAIDASARSAQEHAATLEDRTWKTVLIALPLSAILAIVLSFVVAVRVTRVLRRVASASTQLAQGVLREPIPVTRGDELGDLARAFNAMAVRLGELDRMKEQVFSHLSHELRTPLTSIREASHLLTDGVAGPLAPRQERLVDIICDSTERLLNLVNRSLDLSRLRSGLLSLEQQPVRLREVAARALHEIRPQADAAHVHVEQSTNGTDPWVLGDEERLIEVVMNLVSNAIKASPQGETVRVDVADEGRDVALVVEDHGIGIPADSIGHIFEPYVQGPGAAGGTGLGLAIAKSVVEAHHGEIVVQSEEGRGSRFAVHLPRMDGRA